MKENVGTVDRIGRSVVGPALMAVGYQRWGGRHGNLSGLLAIVGGALIIESAITRVCPINGLLGLDTRSPDQIERDLRQAQIAYREGRTAGARQSRPQIRS